MLEFQATRMRSVVGAVTMAEVEAAFPDWEMLSVASADTTGLGWPLTRTAPQWYRLGRQTVEHTVRRLRSRWAQDVTSRPQPGPSSSSQPEKSMLM